MSNIKPAAEKETEAGSNACSDREDLQAEEGSVNLTNFPTRSSRKKSRGKHGRPGLAVPAIRSVESDTGIDRDSALRRCLSLWNHSV